MFTNGVSVIITGTNDDYKAMSIAWVSQVEKRHLIVSAPKGAIATNLLLKHQLFSVNELGLGQEGIAKQFGGKDCIKNPITSPAKIKLTEHNVPIIVNCCSSTICKVINVVEINEQVLITAGIIDTIDGLQMSPLIFNKAAYFK
ncbi:flavin reductase [Colwellia psychrerythraea]|uniref:Flavin reductase domain protein FMN-binding protein n=1 Tax=Colwellia psychrerythraea TaxID=28229 RepID=A0A099KUG6_COLPS|nr:flavin reductase [Colwellia psychrerythraea]KGJ93840.1 flavin reductase domain protein FMN-binding protein [Colwellia psychrerythraea]